MMTNREIDRIIARGERQAWSRFLLSSRINVPVLMVLSALALLAAAFSQFLVSGLLCLVLASVFGASAFSRVTRFRRNQKVEFWKGIRRHGLSGTPPTGSTRLLIDKIIGLQVISADDELLPTPQAVKLVAAYERQAQQLQKVNERLIRLNVKTQALGEKTAQLQALGEAHPASLRTLEEARADAHAMQQVADEIRDSCARLEAILGAVQKTARARQLHRELDRISESDPISTAIEPAFDAESFEDIERQIGREIETYLRLERETEEHLR